MSFRDDENRLLNTLIREAWPVRHDPLRGRSARSSIRFALNVLQGRKWAEHSHKCGHVDDLETGITGLKQSDGCGHVWHHNSTLIVTEDQNYREHHCPNCGRGPWYLKYRALKKAA